MDLIKVAEEAFATGKQHPKFKSGDTITVTHQYSLLTEIYRNDLRFCPDIQIKPFPEYFRGLHK